MIPDFCRIEDNRTLFIDVQSNVRVQSRSSSCSAHMLHWSIFQFDLTLRVEKLVRFIMRSDIIFCVLPLVWLYAASNSYGFVIPAPDAAPNCDGTASTHSSSKSCSQYWQCEVGHTVPVIKDCKETLQFSEKTGTCVLAGEADCKVYEYIIIFTNGNDIIFY